MITLFLLVAGVLLIGFGAGPTGTKPTPVGTALLLAGLLLWALAVVAAGVAIVQTIRSWTRPTASA